MDKHRKMIIDLQDVLTFEIYHPIWGIDG